MKKIALILTLLTVPACAGNRAPILVGNAAVAVADSIGQLSEAGRQLQEAGVLPVAVALGFQEKLLAANERLKPLPDILRTVDDLQKAGSSTTEPVDRAIAILTVVGQDISVVIGGVPASEATGRLIDLVRAAQQAVSGVLVEVAKIRGRETALVYDERRAA